MKRLIFVDDEPLILDGLRNVLHKYRAVWDMSFVSSGQAALELIERQPQDIVLADMRMPGIDGAELLRQVRSGNPDTARLMLTGQASREDLVRALPVAQQIFGKPCDPAALRTAIERLFTAQAAAGKAGIHTLMGGLDRLPAHPQCHARFLEAMARDDVTVAEASRIIEQDPSLALQTLAIANSCYFGRFQATVSIQLAVQYLGIELLRALALKTDMYEPMGAPLLANPLLGELAGQSLRRAQLARGLVAEPARADEAFTAALLLEVGVIALARCMGEAYLALLSQAARTGRPLRELEREALGFTHAQVGAYLLAAWGLPASLVSLVGAAPAPGATELLPPSAAQAIHMAVLQLGAERSGVSRSAEQAGRGWDATWPAVRGAA